MNLNFNRLYTYLAVSLSLLIPVSGRFAFGIVILLFFNLSVILTVLTIHGIRKFQFEYLKFSLVAFEIIAFTLLFRQITVILCPIIAMSCGFAFFIVAAASVMIPMLFTGCSTLLKEDLLLQLKSSLLISLFCLVFFLFRDIIGFGTVTLPVWQDILVLKIPYLYDHLNMLSFIGTIPSVLLITGILLSLFIKFYGKGKSDIQKS